MVTAARLPFSDLPKKPGPARNGALLSSVPTHLTTGTALRAISDHEAARASPFMGAPGPGSGALRQRPAGSGNAAGRRHLEGKAAGAPPAVYFGWGDSNISLLKLPGIQGFRGGPSEENIFIGNTCGGRMQADTAAEGPSRQVAQRRQPERLTPPWTPLRPPYGSTPYNSYSDGSGLLAGAALSDATARRPSPGRSPNEGY